MPASRGPNDSDKELEQLRALVFGSDGQHVHRAIKGHARALVSDVVSEALVDRQRRDKSVDSVITPIVESSVEKSVSSHSDKLTTILYPLVGRLVRKAVTAFLSQFINKTNDMIESAVSIKGLRWRWQAWRAGVPFSQFLAAQTYRYRVEQVLLIHRETGLLIKSVALNPSADEDADLISSMLTAINDFVSDSFKRQSNEQQLDEVKTDDLTLLITHGPQAVLVAAVSGNLATEVRSRFSETLENVHRLFAQELNNFEGDSMAFEAGDPLLRECLLSEMKDTAQHPQKPPWFGYVFVLALISLLAWWTTQSWLMRQLIIDVEKINAQPGIILTDIKETSLDTIAITLMRDPTSQSVEQWLIDNNIKLHKVSINERSFISTEPGIVKAKLSNLVSEFDGLTLSFDDTPTLVGKLGWQALQDFNRRYYAIAGIEKLNVDRSQLLLSSIELQADNQPAIQRQLFEQLVGEIARIQINFAVNETELDQQGQQSIKDLSGLLRSVFNLAEKLNLSANLIIIGASDTTGTPSVNKRLSLDRANSVKTALINQGIAINRLFSAGIGEVTLSSGAVATRRVMFNVMYTQTEKEQAGSQ